MSAAAEALGDPAHIHSGVRSEAHLVLARIARLVEQKRDLDAFNDPKLVHDSIRGLYGAAIFP